MTLAYNYNKSKVTKFDPGVISADQRIDIVAHLAPNNRATLSANWVRGPFMLNARENYYGSWIDANDYPTARGPAPDPGNILAGSEIRREIGRPTSTSATR